MKISKTVRVWTGLILLSFSCGTLSAQSPTKQLTDAQMRQLEEAKRLKERISHLSDAGNFQEAMQLAEKELGIQKAVLGEESDGAAGGLNILGNLYKSKGDYATARPYLERALEIRKKVLGDDHIGTASSHNNLASLLKDLTDYPAALTNYDRALTIARKQLGEEHPITALTLNNIGVVYELQGEHSAARTYFEQSLKIRRKVKGDEHPDIAQSLNNIGASYHTEGNFKAAQPYFEKSLMIGRKAWGDEDPEIATHFHNLGAVLKAQGNYISARPYYEQSLKIRRKYLGYEHPETVGTFDNCAALEAATGNWSLAGRLTDEARRGVRQHVARILPTLSEKQQVNFLVATDQAALHRALTLGLLNRHDSELPALSASWLINGKGVAQAAQAERVLLARDVNDPKMAGSVAELIEIRRKLAGVALAAPQSGKEAARRKMLEELTVQEERLARRVTESYGGPARAAAWVELDDVKDALPDDGVLVDIAQIQPFNFSWKGNDPSWQPAHYVAWIVPYRGDVQIVDLGLAEPIDAAVAKVRKSMEDATSPIGALLKQGEPAVERQLREELQAVVNLVWMPLVDKLGNAKRLMLSPDADLWLLPWAALPVSQDRFLIEDYTVSYVISGRDLVSNQKNKITTTPAVVMANPNFDLTAEQVKAAILAVFRNFKFEDIAQANALSVQNVLPKVLRLPGTATEAAAIKPSIEQYAGALPQEYMDNFALESILKKVHRPKVVVLSTHGFFLPDQEVQKTNDLGSGETHALTLTVDGKPIENPLLRCGLLFAGCNSRQSAGGDDGILTGMEIVGIDLRGTELVVLSACETGIGKVRNGEGVAGLRQAFQLAGANAVVATLWQVPDLESARTMNDFFINLAKGQNKTEALRAAQLSRIAARRDKYGAAHPYFWAAYTLTGQ